VLFFIFYPDDLLYKSNFDYNSLYILFGKYGQIVGKQGKNNGKQISRAALRR
jgi:hypothetical protein